MSSPPPPPPPSPINSPPQQPPRQSEITPATDDTETGSSSSSPPPAFSTTLLRRYIDNEKFIDEYDIKVWEAFDHPETMNDLIRNNRPYFNEKANLMAQIKALPVLVITSYREFEVACDVAGDTATFVVHRSTPEADVAKISEIKDINNSVFFDVDDD